MFKLFIVIVLITSCGYIGVYKSNTYKYRVIELEDIYETIKLLQTEINYRKDSLPVIFRRLSEGKDTISSKILSGCVSRLNSSGSFENSWTNSICAVSDHTHLTADDLTIIKDLGSRLGKSGTDGQTDILKLTESKLCMQIDKATTEKITKGKMYSSLGFTSGILLAVVLI